MNGASPGAIPFLLLFLAACSDDTAEGHRAGSGGPNGGGGGGALGGGGSGGADGGGPNGGGGPGGGGGAGGGGGEEPPTALDTQGGIVEAYTDTEIRDQDNIDLGFLPSTRTGFTFPSPYDTFGVRLTILDDCTGSSADRQDCVRQTGYSDWQNLFTQGDPSSPEPDVVCGWLNFSDFGLRKFCYTLSTDTVVWADIFQAGDDLFFFSGDGAQASPTEPGVLYLQDGPQYKRCFTGGDTTTLLPLDSDDPGDCEVVGDVTSLAARTAAAAGIGGVPADYVSFRIWTPHVSADGTRFSATLRRAEDPYDDVGAIFMTGTDTWLARPAVGDPFLDLSGQYAGYASDVAGCVGGSNDFTVVDLDDGGAQYEICDGGTGAPHPPGAPGHLAFGYKHMLASDNNASADGGAGYEQVKLWNLANIAAGGTLVTSYPANLPDGFGQPAWGAAVPEATTAIADQMVCHTNTALVAPSPPVPRERELYCYRPGSPTVLVVAPNMTDMAALGTGGNETSTYYRAPKPNVSSDGRWYILVTNAGTDRMDAYLVRIPRANLPTP